MAFQLEPIDEEERADVGLISFIIKDITTNVILQPPVQREALHRIDGQLAGIVETRIAQFEEILFGRLKLSCEITGVASQRDRSA